MTSILRSLCRIIVYICDNMCEYFMQTYVQLLWTRVFRNIVRNDCLKAFSLTKEVLIDHFYTLSNQSVALTLDI